MTERALSAVDGCCCHYMELEVPSLGRSDPPHQEKPANEGVHKMIPIVPLRRSLSSLLGPLALLLALACLGATSAHACPEGTVFSAYNGNGICAYVGQGATVAVQCTPMVNSCLPGTSREHKTRGDTGYYCCSKTIANEQGINCVWRGTAPACDGHCLFGEQKRGAAHDQIHADTYRSTKAWSGSFGKDCEGGAKALCCHHIGLD
jgi:hypothetical protein